MEWLRTPLCGGGLVQRLPHLAHELREDFGAEVQPARIERVERARVQTELAFKRLDQRRLVLDQRRPAAIQQTHAVDRAPAHLAQQLDHVRAHFGIGVGQAGRPAALPVDAAPLGMPFVDAVAPVEVVVGRRKAKPRHAVGRVQLEADLVRVVRRHVERIDVLLAEHAAALDVQAVEDPGKVAQPVEGRLASRLGVGEHQVAATDFPVEPREIGVAVGLDLALDVPRRGQPPETQGTVGVLVGEQPPGVAARRVRLNGPGFGGIERHQLDISHAGAPALHGPGSIARRHPPRHLAQDEPAPREVGGLPEHLDQRLRGLAVVRQLQEGGHGFVAQSDLELEAAAFVDRAPRQHPDRHRMPAVHVQRQVDLGRRGLRPRHQHHAGQPVGGVAHRAPVPAFGRGRQRLGRATA